MFGDILFVLLAIGLCYGTYLIGYGNGDHDARVEISEKLLLDQNTQTTSNDNETQGERE